MARWGIFGNECHPVWSGQHDPNPGIAADWVEGAIGRELKVQRMYGDMQLSTTSGSATRQFPSGSDDDCVGVGAAGVGLPVNHRAVYRAIQHETTAVRWYDIYTNNTVDQNGNNLLPGGQTPWQYIEQQALNYYNWNHPFYIAPHHEPIDNAFEQWRNTSTKAIIPASAANYGQYAAKFYDLWYNAPGVNWANRPNFLGIVINFQSAVYNQPGTYGDAALWFPTDSSKYDIVGIDSYNRGVHGAPSNPNETNVWENWVDDRSGYPQCFAWAKSKGKKVLIGEIGCVEDYQSRPAQNGTISGDPVVTGTLPSMASSTRGTQQVITVTETTGTVVPRTPTATDPLWIVAEANTADEETMELVGRTLVSGQTYTYTVKRGKLRKGPNASGGSFGDGTDRQSSPVSHPSGTAYAYGGDPMRKPAYADNVLTFLYDSTYNYYLNMEGICWTWYTPQTFNSFPWDSSQLSLDAFKRVGNDALFSPGAQYARLTWAEMQVADAPRKAQVSYAELRVPDVGAPSPEIVPQISWAELEVSNGARFALLSFAELEITPIPPRQVYLFWAAFEAPGGAREASVSWAVVEIPEHSLTTPGGGMSVPMGRPHDPHHIHVYP